MQINYPRTRLLGAALGLLLLASSGCYSPPAEFQFNWVYMAHEESKLPTVDVDSETNEQLPGEFSDEQRRNVAEIMTATFGTPQEPRMTGAGATNYISEYKLRMAAGPVGRDELTQEPRGLYRQHCAHCHGVTGDGMGPTARFLNPYPRDYRPGIFKFKMTEKSDKPKKEDLLRTLKEGIPGTAMPSFMVLPEDELAALVDSELERLQS